MLTRNQGKKYENVFFFVFLVLWLCYVNSLRMVDLLLTVCLCFQFAFWFMLILVFSVDFPFTPTRKFLNNTSGRRRLTQATQGISVEVSDEDSLFTKVNGTLEMINCPVGKGYVENDDICQQCITGIF